jgi:hypothetical protein
VWIDIWKSVCIFWLYAQRLCELPIILKVVLCDLKPHCCIVPSKNLVLRTVPNQLRSSLWPCFWCQDQTFACKKRFCKRQPAKSFQNIFCRSDRLKRWQNYRSKCRYLLFLPTSLSSFLNLYKNLSYNCEENTKKNAEPNMNSRREKKSLHTNPS